MYLRRYKISKGAFLENISQQLPLYIIWFRVLPNQKFYFMSETYLKPSQISKMKLLVKVVHASRDVFRTIFSIQNVFRTSRMVLFERLKAVHFFRKKLHLRYFVGSWKCLWIHSISLFSPKTASQIFKRTKMLLHVFSSTNLEMNK